MTQQMNHAMPDLRPEEKLLLHLCKPFSAITADAKERISVQGDKESALICMELVRKVDNWDYFLKIANEHGVIALCRHNLNSLGCEGKLPGNVSGKLRSGYLKSLTRNTFLDDLLKEVTDLASGEKIKIVLLKGQALEKTVYGNRGLRQMNDIDILVGKGNAIRLRKLLLENGFRSIPMISPLHEKILPSYGKHLPELVKKDVAVEIHIKLFSEKANSLTEEMISTAVKIPGYQDGVSCPEPLLSFLYLVKHLDWHEKNGNSQLRLYADLLIMLKNFRNEILNERLFEYAGIAGLRPALEEKLYILEKWWCLDMGNYSGIISGNTDPMKADEQFRNFLGNPDFNLSAARHESLLSPMKEFTLLSHKLYFIAGYLFPSISFMKYRYNVKGTAAAVAYYPVRWLKLAGLILRGKL